MALRLKRAEQALRRQLHPLLVEQDITFEHWQVLSALQEEPGLRMSDLAEAAVLAPATLTRYVDRLVERAFVVRRIDAEDRRIAVIALSQSGTALVARIEAAEARDQPEVPARTA